MSLPIPEKFHDLFKRPILCALTTVNQNGQPHSVPVWCDFDGEHVRVNMPAGTKKARNLKANHKLSLLVIDPQNNRHWIEIQGHVGVMNDEAHGARADAAAAVSRGEHAAEAVAAQHGVGAGEAARREGVFRSIQDVVRRTGLDSGKVARLAEGGPRPRSRP